jgi:small-conductance mechanosensitive channel
MGRPLNDVLAIPDTLLDLSMVDELEFWMQAIIAVLFVGFAALFTSKIILGVLRKLAGRTQPSWDDDLVEIVSSRVLFSVTLVAGLFMVQWLFDDFGESAPPYVYATLILISASALSSTIKVVFTTFLDNMQNKREVKVEGSNPLLVFLARGSAWAFGIVLAAEQLSINLSGVLASLAVFSIIIGLAVQHTLGNIMNSFMLSLDRPFDNGDRIVVDGIEGTVMAMGMLSTKILTLEEELVIIPNNTLINTTITNMARGGGDGLPRRVVLSVDIGVDYSEKSAHVKHTLLRVARDSEYVLEDPIPHVEFLDMSDYAKVYRLYVWLASFADKRIANDQLLSMIDAEFVQEGIMIPFPVAVELDKAPAPSEEKLSQKRARQHAAQARMKVIDRRTERQRLAIREDINILTERLEDRIGSRERRSIEEEVTRLEAVLSNLDID